MSVEAVGDQEQVDGVQNEQESKEEKLVKETDHKRVLDDMHKYKKQTKELQMKISDFEKKLQEAETSKLHEKQDYKTLYETEKQLREESDRKKRELQTTVLYNEKFRAASQALTKAGLRPEAMSLLDNNPLDEIQVDVANGKFIVDGVETLVESWKSKFGFAFSQESVKINNGGGATKTQKTQELTPAYMVQLETKDPEKYKEMLPLYMKQRAERSQKR